MNQVEETAERIRSMEIRGAGRIARAGAAAIGSYAEEFSGDSLDAFNEGLRRAAETILASRPTAVSLWNAVHLSMMGADRAADTESARRLVSENARRFCDDSISAVSRIAEYGSRLISDGDTVLTHCNSSVAVGIIKKAVADGKDVKAYATETRPWGQGLITVNELADAGVDVTLITDSAAGLVMKGVDKVFVGADTVRSDGSLVNKVGTSQIALAAKAYGARFHVCTETYKFSPLTLMGDPVTIEVRDASEIAPESRLNGAVKVFNPVFDLTPARDIDAIITELGIMSPGSVYQTIVTRYGDFIFKE